MGNKQSIIVHSAITKTHRCRFFQMLLYLENGKAPERSVCAIRRRINVIKSNRLEFGIHTVL